MIWRIAQVILGLILTFGVAMAEVFSARVTAVPDGDTLWVQPQDGGEPRKLRLQGIDAPEICQIAGVQARDELHQLVDQKLLQVVVKYHDDFGRGLAHIEVNGQDIGAEMVRSGMAWSPGWRHRLGPYHQEEVAAKKNKRGLFAQDSPEIPRDFRRRHGTCYPQYSSTKFKQVVRTPGTPGYAESAPR